MIHVACRDLHHHYILSTRGLLLAVSPHILLEADVGSQTTLMFLRELHDQYSTMINSPGGKHEHLYETGEEHRVIDDVSLNIYTPQKYVVLTYIHSID